MKPIESLLHIRPRFNLCVPYSFEEAIEIISKEIKDNPNIKGKIVDNHVLLDVPLKDRHYFSPQLSFRIEHREDEPQKACIKGIIGPRPGVWAMFLYLYIIIGMVGAVVSMYGFALKNLGTENNYTYALPITIVLLLSSYVSSKFGEEKGKDQVEQLKRFLLDNFHVTHYN